MLPCKPENLPGENIIYSIDKKGVKDHDLSDKLSLLLVAVFAVLFLGERPSAREWFGILLVGAGAIILGFKR
jgi:drug/metabolite transporter (DMT)-like permease